MSVLNEVALEMDDDSAQAMVDIYGEYEPAIIWVGDEHGFYGYDIYVNGELVSTMRYGKDRHPVIYVSPDAFTIGEEGVDFNALIKSMKDMQ